MPRATVSIEPIRHDLKSLPGGYVVLRRMPYGKWLTRQEMALKLRVEATKGKGTVAGEMGMANKLVTVFEFKECVVEHNLEGEDGQLLNFAADFTLEILDPRVGNEIGGYISEMHEFDSGNSPTASDTSSLEAAKIPMESPSS